jgi:hypothetical protein
VSRPVTLTKDQMQAELEISISIEALVLEGVKPRKELVPTGVKSDDLPSKPARENKQYAMIPGRNIFYGSERIGGPEIQRQPPPFDLLPEIVLDEITIDDQGSVASFFDSADIVRYRVRARRPDGPFRIDSYMYLNESKRIRDQIGETELMFRDSATKKEYGPFKPIRIYQTGIVLEDNGKYYYLHVGYHLNEVRLIKLEEAVAMGLPVSTQQKDDKEKPSSSDKNQKKVISIKGG